MSKETNNPGLEGFERALMSLRPAPPDVDRDRIMFAAGRKAAQTAGRRHGSRLWPLAMVAAGIAAFACGMALAPSSKPLIVRQTVYVERDIWPTIEEVSQPIIEKRPNPFGLAVHTSRSWTFDATDPPERVRLPQREITLPLERLNRPGIRAHSIRDFDL